MIDNKALAQSISQKISFELLDDRILVKPLKPIMIVKELPAAPTQQPSSLDEAEQQETKLEKRKVEANIRKGIVIKLGPEYLNNNPSGIEVGDVVYYPAFGGVNFEAFKDTRMLRRYEVFAVEHSAV
jgi:co-chaperonin GroES (HSP10)